METQQGMELLIKMNGDLGEIRGTLKGFQKKLDSIENQAKLTNGRVTKLEGAQVLSTPFKWNWEVWAVALTSVATVIAYIIDKA